jgi:hypothetical protein
MNAQQLKQLLNDVKDGRMAIEDAMAELKKLPFEDMGFAHLDTHRELRNGYPEVIYCAGKTADQVTAIVKRMLELGYSNILATRADSDVARALQALTPNVEYNTTARIAVINRKPLPQPDGIIAVVTGGTSDMPVAEEAAITAEIMGNNVKRIYDVGVAGLHRLLSHLDEIMSANVVIAVAGMEGALASVVGGLVDKPVIAVPTSVGYGANFHGLAALLSMLNSCASGVAVVNIDNGFGAGYMASMINHM